MSVQHIIDRKGSGIVSIRPEATIREAADYMRRLGVAALIVTAGGHQVDIVSERDIVHALSRQGEAALAERVITVASRPVSVAPTDSLKRAMSLMTQHRARHLLVVDEGRAAGIVSIGDVVKHRLEDLELETNVLRDSFIASHALSLH
jgi:CBS domain-containing protein